MIRLRETMKGSVAAELITHTIVSKADQYKKKKRKR